MKVSVLGSGLIGSKVTEKLIKTKHRVTVYNRTKSKVQKFPSRIIASTPAEAIKQSEVIILTLTDKKAIDKVLFSRKNISFNNKTVIQMGTIAPQESQELLLKIKRLNGEYFECPILGSRGEIEQGTVLLMFGGSKKQFGRWKSLLRTLGPNLKYVGNVGQAAALKLAFNQLIASHVIAFSVSLGLIQKNKIDVKLFSELLGKSSLYTPMYFKKLPNWLKHNYANPNFPTKHLLKDVDLIIKEVKRCHVSDASLKAFRTNIKKAMNQGLADKDYSSIFEVINS